MSDKQVFYIDYDEDGNEIKNPKGKGRTKLGYVLKEDGNWYADKDFDRDAYMIEQRASYKVKHYYIILDTHGNEISRKPVGRGKPPKGYTRRDDGNFYKVTAHEQSQEQSAAVSDLNPTMSTMRNESVV